MREQAVFQKIGDQGDLLAGRSDRVIGDQQGVRLVLR